MESKTLETSPIDLAAFRVSLRAAGIEDIVEPTLSLFVEESSQLLETMHEAASAGNAEAMRRAAHALKGSAGNVRARPLSETAASLETTASEGDLTAAVGLLELASREHTTLVDYLAENGLGQ